MTELGVEGGDYAGCSEDRDDYPVALLEGWVAVEAVVDCWYCGAPHEDYDAVMLYESALLF